MWCWVECMESTSPTESSNREWKIGAMEFMVEESDDSTPLYKYERNISETS